MNFVRASITMSTIERLQAYTRDNSRWLLPSLFAVLAVLSIPAYMYARAKMTIIIGYLYIIESNITLNFILLLFFCGWFTDKATKHMSRRKAWTIFVIQLVVVIVLFRLLGFQTIFG